MDKEPEHYRVELTMMTIICFLATITITLLMYNQHSLKLENAQLIQYINQNNQTIEIITQHCSKEIDNVTVIKTVEQL